MQPLGAVGVAASQLQPGQVRGQGVLSIQVLQQWKGLLWSMKADAPLQPLASAGDSGTHFGGTAEITAVPIQQLA